MIELARSRVAWAIVWRSGALLDIHGRELLDGSELDGTRPPGLLAAWPTLLFTTRKDARAFVRVRYGVEPDDNAASQRRPRVVCVRTRVEVIARKRDWRAAA